MFSSPTKLGVVELMSVDLENASRHELPSVSRFMHASRAELKSYFQVEIRVIPP